MERSYLVRYGRMTRVGRFRADSAGYERGQQVVVRTHRGNELGEVLLEIEPRAGEAGPTPDHGPAWVLRAAGADDLECARSAEDDRPRRLAACRRVFEEGVWPLELIDVEP